MFSDEWSFFVKVGVFRSEGDGYQPPGEEVFSINHLFFDAFPFHIFSNIYSIKFFSLSKVLSPGEPRGAARGEGNPCSVRRPWDGPDLSPRDGLDHGSSEFSVISSESLDCSRSVGQSPIWEGFLRRTRCRLFWSKNEVFWAQIILKYFDLGCEVLHTSSDSNACASLFNKLDQSDF